MFDAPAIAEPLDDAQAGDRWIIELRPLASDIPAGVRLRHFLKRALRDWGLRCESVGRATESEQMAWLRGECVRLHAEVDRLRRRLARPPRREKATVP